MSQSIDSNPSATSTPASLHDLAAKFGKDLAEFHRIKVEQQPEYADSWRKRGPAIAFANLNRKIERLDSLVQGYGYDIFAALKNSEAVVDCYKDILVYIGLHASCDKPMTEYFQQLSDRSRDIGVKYGEPWQLTQGIGAYADISRKMDSLQQYAKECDFKLLEPLSRGDFKAWERLGDLAGYMLMGMGRALQINPSLDL